MSAKDMDWTDAETDGGRLAAVSAIGFGLILCFTGFGLLLGISVILAGLLAPLYAHKIGLTGLVGPCPYCDEEVKAFVSDKGATCKACHQRIVVRDRQFGRVRA